MNTATKLVVAGVGTFATYFLAWMADATSFYWKAYAATAGLYGIYWLYDAGYLGFIGNVSRGKERTWTRDEAAEWLLENDYETFSMKELHRVKETSRPVKIDGDQHLIQAFAGPRQHKSGKRDRYWMGFVYDHTKYGKMRYDPEMWSSKNAANPHKLIEDVRQKEEERDVVVKDGRGRPQLIRSPRDRKEED